MGNIADQFAAAFRDFVTEGVPASGEHEPVKSEIRAIGPLIETALGNAALGALVDVTYATRAALNGDLAHPANSVALVYADPTEANNDLYVKAGASGAGSWTLTTSLHAAVQSLVASEITPAAESAQAAAALAAEKLVEVNTAGATQITAIGVAGDAELNDIAAAGASQAAAVSSSVALGAVSAQGQTTLGTTTPNGSNTSAILWSNGFPLAQDSRIDSIATRWSAAATVEILAVNPGSRRVVAKTASLNVTGTNAVTTLANPFGATIIPQGSVFFIRRLSGTGVLRFAGTSGVNAISVPDATYAVGDQLVAYTRSANVEIALAILVTAATAPVGARVGTLETNNFASAFQGESSPARTTALGGYTGLTPSNVLATLMPAILVPDDSIATGIRANISGAGTGLVGVWHPSGSGHHRLARRFPVTLASGDNTIPLPRFIIPGRSFVTYEPITGNNLTFHSGGFWQYGTIAAHAIDDTTSFLADPNPGTPNFQVIVEVPHRRSHRSNRTANAAAHSVVSERFAGTTSRFDWTLGSAFSWSNGLLSSGAGGWTNTAMFTPAGLGYSSIRRKRLAGVVTITDTASIVGICTQPRREMSGAERGAVAEIDGAANRLRLYFWTGTATAGTQRAEAAIPALVAGRSYLLEFVTDYVNCTATLRDCVTGALLGTVTETENNGGRARGHGRPGVMHRAGNVKWEWVDFAHNAPRNCRAVVIGDSNTENVNTSTNPSWVTMLDQTYGGIVNAGQGTGDSRDMMFRLADIIDLRPQFVILNIGTNDAVLANWRACMQQAIGLAECIGAEPILCTPPPKTTNGTTQALVTAQAGDITGGYFGRYRVIDLLGLLSNNGDRLTWNPTYGGGDGVHLIAAGHSFVAGAVPSIIPQLTW